MNMIYDADSVLAASSFIKRILLGSMLFKDLIKHFPYDMAEVRTQAEGIFRVLDNREKLNKKVTTIFVDRATPSSLMQNMRSYPQSSSNWNKRQKIDQSNYSRQPR